MWKYKIRASLIDAHWQKNFLLRNLISSCGSWVFFVFFLFRYVTPHERCHIASNQLATLNRELDANLLIKMRECWKFTYIHIYDTFECYFFSPLFFCKFFPFFSRFCIYKIKECRVCLFILYLNNRIHYRYFFYKCLNLSWTFWFCIVENFVCK